MSVPVSSILVCTITRFFCRRFTFWDDNQSAYPRAESASTLYPILQPPVRPLFLPFQLRFMELFPRIFTFIEALVLCLSPVYG